MKLKRIILSDFMFLLIIILLAILSVFSYQRINDLNNDADLVNHTNLIKLNLVQTLSHVSDAEARQRYFLLTADTSYLHPLLDGLKKNQENLDQLDSLTKDNDEQQGNVKELKLLTNKRFQRLNMVVESRDKTSAPVMRSLLSEGKLVMDQIQTLVAKMIRLEDGLLVKRSSKKNYSAFITPRYSLLLSVFAIFIVGFAYFILRNETRLRFHVQDNIKRLNDYFRDLPALFAIVKGPAHIHEITNSLYQEISGSRDLEGKSYREAFPELAGQGLYELLDKVYATGKPFIGKELPVTMNRVTGKMVTGFFNIIYQPVFNDKSQIEGILIFGYEITEIIDARKKMEEAEQRSRLAIEAANIGTFDWNMENNLFDSSPRLLEIFGFRPNEKNISHTDLLENFHPDDRGIRDKAVEESYINGGLIYEARVIWPDKSIHWVNVYGKIIRNTANEATRMFGTAIDITKQKNILEDLRESEAKFRLLADSMPQLIWTGDAQGNLDYFNQAVFNFSGLTPEEIENRGWITIMHPDDREENRRNWKNSIITGEEFVAEHRFKNFNGEYRWQLSRATPQRDHHGEIQRWVGTSTDIQDQKERSRELEQEINDRTKELSELNKNLLIKNSIFIQAEENALIGSYSWNLQSGILEYSDNLYRLFGYEPNEFVPDFEKYHSMIHPEDKEQVMKDGLETINTKNLVANNYRIITKTGKIRHFRSTGKIIGEADNVLLIGTVQDISHDTFLNEILRLKNLQLERSNAELESFNYIASHDLQEPLRKIQAFSQRILQRESNNFSEFGKDYFSRINASAARMQNLINALLNYSRADAANKDITAVDLNVLIENVKTELQDMIEEKGASVEFVALPTIKAVSIQVHQLFTNLLSNAIKYSKAGIAPRIRIMAFIARGSEINDTIADKKINYWKITVTDNGIGFEQEYEYKIFELFQRLHSGIDYTGTGIGLAICKKIMRNHEGFISATGKPGIGSTFNIYFPLSL